MESCQARSAWRRMQRFLCKISTAMIFESAVFEDRGSDNGLRLAWDGAVTAVLEKIGVSILLSGIFGSRMFQELLYITKEC